MLTKIQLLKEGSFDLAIRASATGRQALPPSHRHSGRRCALRTENGVMQETLAHLAGIERSHSKVERGKHAATLVLIFKIAGALECNTAALMA
ncbi:hypothetical protein Q066_05094 [Pseudomonas aeruginosa BL12]|nr:hypothetical protein Q066_05094 [Pseudomonas aeruginosa BL12]